MESRNTKKARGSVSNDYEAVDSPNISSEYWVKRDDEDIRVYAAISFAFLLIVVGIPLWWKTTEVYRVHVPYGRIDDLKEMDISFAVTITIVSKNKDRTSSLISYLSNSTTLTANGLVNPIFKEANDFDIEDLLKSPSLEDLNDYKSIPNHSGELFLVEVPGLLRFTLNDVVVGTKRTVYFSQQASGKLLEDVLNLWLIQPKSLSQTHTVMENPNEYKSDKFRRRRMPPAAQYDLMFSVVHPEPEKRSFVWNIQESVSAHMNGFIGALSSLVPLHVKSQWLYFVKLEGRTKRITNDDGVSFTLSEEVLPHVITPLEKKLGSGVGEHPTIQLVLYIPPCKFSPMFVTSNKVEIPPSLDFLSPRWGSVQIYNPPSSTCSIESDNFHLPNSSHIMGSFMKHVKLLIGVPELVRIKNVEQLPLPVVGVRDWEIDNLMRLRALEHLISARITLKSLAQLLDEISNIVITDEVGSLIWKAITNSHESANGLLHGDLIGGFHASKEAFLAAETAFSDPSLLALLYFPDDQKYAVYIPLFLPVMIPVLMSLRSIRTWWITGTTRSADEKEKTE